MKLRAMAIKAVALLLALVAATGVAIGLLRGRSVMADDAANTAEDNAVEDKYDREADYDSETYDDEEYYYDEEYTKLIETEPDNLNAYVDAGKILVEKGHHDNATKQAIDYFRQAIALEPQSASEYLSRGDANYFLSNFERAIADYDTAIQMEPELVEAYLGKGAVYDAMEQHRQAINDYTEVIQSIPNDARAYNSRGFAYIEQLDAIAGKKDLAEAERLGLENSKFVDREGMRFSVAFYIEEVEPYGGTEGYFDKKNSDLLIRLNEEIDLNPNSDDAYIRRGGIHQAMQEYDKALDDLNKAISFNPGNYEAYFHRAYAHMCLENFDAADADLDRALQLYPESEELRDAVKQLRQEIEQLRAENNRSAASE